MDQTVLYTVKVLYSDNHVSEGVSVDATVPFEELPAASGVRSEVSGRTVTLHWSLPSAAGITGVRVLCNGTQVAQFEGAVTNCELKQQPMGEELVYSVEVIYDDFYTAKATAGTAIVIEKLLPKQPICFWPIHPHSFLTMTSAPQPHGSLLCLMLNL